MAMSPHYVQYLLTQGDLLNRIMAFNADFNAKQQSLRATDPKNKEAHAITDSLYKVHPELARFHEENNISYYFESPVDRLCLLRFDELDSLVVYLGACINSKSLAAVTLQIEKDQIYDTIGREAYNFALDYGYLIKNLDFALNLDGLKKDCSYLGLCALKCLDSLFSTTALRQYFMEMLISYTKSRGLDPKIITSQEHVLSVVYPLTNMHAPTPGQMNNPVQYTPLDQHPKLAKLSGSADAAAQAAQDQASLSPEEAKAAQDLKDQLDLDAAFDPQEDFAAARGHQGAGQINQAAAHAYQQAAQANLGEQVNNAEQQAQEGAANQAANQTAGDNQANPQGQAAGNQSANQSQDANVNQANAANAAANGASAVQNAASPAQIASTASQANPALSGTAAVSGNAVISGNGVDGQGATGQATNALNGQAAQGLDGQDASIANADGLNGQASGNVAVDANAVNGAAPAQASAASASNGSALNAPNNGQTVANVDGQAQALNQAAAQAPALNADGTGTNTSGAKANTVKPIAHPVISAPTIAPRGAPAAIKGKDVASLNAETGTAGVALAVNDGSLNSGEGVQTIVDDFSDVPEGIGAPLPITYQDIASSVGTSLIEQRKFRAASLRQNYTHKDLQEPKEVEQAPMEEQTLITLEFNAQQVFYLTSIILKYQIDEHWIEYLQE